MVNVMVTGVTGVAVISGVAGVVAMVIIVAMCVCMQSDKDLSEPGGDIEMSRQNGHAKKSKKNKESRVVSTEVQIREDKTQTNGSVPVDANGRPMSHEDRALPEIPNANGDTMMQTDDEEEPDGGHYDVISRTQPRNQPQPRKAGKQTSSNSSSGGSFSNKKKKQEKSNKENKNSTSLLSSIKKNHAYEKVTGPGGDLDSDSTTYATAINDPMYAAVSEKSSEFDPTYAGVKDDTASDSTYAGVKDSQSESSLGGSSSNYAAAAGAGNKHPYATVVNIGEAEYAQITEKKSHSKKKSKNSKHKKMPSLTRCSDTMDSIAAPPPPVPEKILEYNSMDTNLNNVNGNNKLGINTNPAASPNLPPRNSGSSPTSTCTSSAFDSALQDIPYADEVNSAGNSPVHQASPALSQTGAMGVSITNSMASQQSLEQGGASGGKREPPYSKVTARESLDELRRRQALEPNSELPSEADPNAFNYEAMDYDQINYEMVKSPASGRTSQSPAQPLMAQQTGDRASLCSDLYAEIGSTAEAMQSQRSSTYARVSELPQGPNHAPTPPPVETMRNLSHLPKHEELPEAGYHQVRDIRRPNSVCSTGSSNYNTVQDVVNYQQQQQHENLVEYAVVDKSKKAKKRQTVHVSQNLSHSLHLDHTGNKSGASNGVKADKNNSLFAVVDDLDHLYAQVDKSSKRQNNGSAASSSIQGNGNYHNDSGGIYDNQTFFQFNANAGNGLGARPKEYNNASNGKKLSPSMNNNKKSKSKKDNNEDFNSGSLTRRSRESLVNNNNRGSVTSDHVNSNNPSPIVNRNDGLLRNNSKVAPGYQTIGGVALPPGDPFVEDPDYDTVEESRIVIHMSDHDPNYESLPGSATGMVVSASAAAAHASASNGSTQPVMAATQEVNMNPGGASQIRSNPDGSTQIQLNPDGTSQIQIGGHNSNNPQNWRRREHIYQEIQDAKNENIYTPDPTSHPRRHGDNGSSAGGATGGGGSGQPVLTRKSSQQYITNL